MSSGGNDQAKNNNQVPQKLYDRLREGGKKTKSLFSYAHIHRVPEDLRKRKQNESAYTPCLIAIGPLHRDIEQRQKPMTDVKKFYAYYLFHRVAKGILEEGREKLEDNTKKMKRKESGESEDNWKILLDDKRRELLEECEKQMKAKEFVDKAKKHYAEEVKLKDDEMAEMMLVDGCFILELLCCYHHIKTTKDAGKSTTNGGDSGNSEASSSSVPQPNNKGEDRSSGGSEQRKDPIFDNTLTANIVQHDLLLLENQIPFFVLEELFKLTVDKIPGGTKLSLTEYVVSYFDNIISPEIENSGSKMNTSSCSQRDCAIWVCGSTNEGEQGKKVSGNDTNYHHILHVLHHYYVPGGQRENSAGGCSPWRCTIPGCCSPCRCTVASCCCSPWRCTIGCKTTPKNFTELEIRAKDLDYAGVKFVGVDIEGNNLFDVKFEERNCLYWWFRRAKFQIPTLHIHDPTESFLRNLIAFEQSCPEIKMIFTPYAKFMDMLINDEEDVRVLRKAKVIRNLLGEDKDVSKLFNNLCKEVVLKDFYFNDKCQDAYKYSKHCWPKCMAYLRRTYFASPWTFIGFCLALIAFGIQITNFVRSFLK